MRPVDRREFTKLLGSAGVLSLLPLSSIAAESLTQKPLKELSINVFSKHLQFLDYPDMAKAAREIGFAGLDLTVRPNGHVSPEKVEEQLPRAVEAIRAQGLKTQMMTTSAIDVEDPLHTRVIDTAKQLGFGYFRTSWLRYSEDQSIRESLKSYQTLFKKLEKYVRKKGICAAYQNHAGYFYGSSIWDLWEVLKENGSDFLGCQYDIRHAVVEGGLSWYQDLRLIYPYIRTIVLKDFRWERVNGKWRPVSCPIGEGMVDFIRYFKFLQDKNIQVPVSLHFEYSLGGAQSGKREINIPPKDVYAAMKKDLIKVRELWKLAAEG